MNKRYQVEIWDYHHPIDLGEVEILDNQDLICAIVSRAVAKFGTEQAFLDYCREWNSPEHTFTTARDLVLYAGEFTEIFDENLEN